MSREMSLRFGNKTKREVYKRADGRCEHPEGCEVTDMKRLTIDHFTPKCIAQALGWKRRQLNSLANLQLLCEEHHQQKDSTTPAKKHQVLFQLHGGEIRFGEHV